MEITSVYLCNSIVHIAVGKEGTKQVKLQRLCSLQLEEGCLINGVITNETALAAQLDTFWRTNSLPRKNVTLIIDSTQFATKTVQVPMLPPKKLLEIAKNELAPSMESRQDAVVDYMVLQQNAQTKQQTILAAGAERSFLQQYVALFEKCEISLSCITTALAGQMKLVSFLPVFVGKTCILMLFDGDNLQAILVENGRYKYSSRTRLFGEHGAAEFGTEVARVVSSMLQFQASDKSEFSITAAYFAGCTQADYEVCANGCRTLNVTPDWLPDDNNVALPDAALHLSDCSLVAGSFIMR